MTNIVAFTIFQLVCVHLKIVKYGPHLWTLLLPNAVCLGLTYNYFEKRHFQSTLNPLYEEIEIYPLLGKSTENNGL